MHLNPASLGLIPGAKSESDACRKFFSSEHRKFYE